MNTHTLRAAFKDAIAKLNTLGYCHSHSIIDDSGTGGMVFTKTLPDTTFRRFVLNIDTYSNLPTE